jgi:hypothetical protein
MVEQRIDCVWIRTDGGRHAVWLDRVESCLALPRLTPLEQTAPWVLGAFDLHGELVPVISLELLLGRRAPAAASSDLVLVGRARGFLMGVRCIRPARIDLGDSERPRPARIIDLNRVRLTDALGGDSELRLAAFERRLSVPALRQLDRRAACYGEFTAPAARGRRSALPAPS